MKLIDKDALVAEIKRRKQVAFGWMETAPNDAIEAEFELCDDILSFINTLEVKEVDLDAFGILAEHLLACEAHAVSPKYRDEELDLLEQLKKLREEL